MTKEELERHHKTPVQPFFTRFLENQVKVDDRKKNQAAPTTLKYPSDWDEW